MENATKALLIAAAVLIVIVLISIGILLLKNSSSTAKQSETVGREIGLATDEAIRDYQKVYISKEEFNDFMNDFKQKYSNRWEVMNTIDLQNSKIRKQIKIYGYAYQKDFNAFRSEKGYTEYSNLQNKLIQNQQKLGSEDLKTYNQKTKELISNMLSSGTLKRLNNPQNITKIEEELKIVYDNYTGSKPYVFDKTYYAASFISIYGTDGYIDEMNIVYGIAFNRQRK